MAEHDFSKVDTRVRFPSPAHSGIFLKPAFGDFGGKIGLGGPDNHLGGVEKITHREIKELA